MGSPAPPVASLPLDAGESPDTTTRLSLKVRGHPITDMWGRKPRLPILSSLILVQSGCWGVLLQPHSVFNFAGVDEIGGRSLFCAAVWLEEGG